ncbi:endolytic transglycosylase MltG [Nonomuraea sp. SMC257]|uniref:Endolytic murein transglycosylase n=1 Tax=Nonomuraea montanisoli TaxID=2741721 RepID=A0A7Y6IFF1_9ACTN|nr:endolytic transglycosylase MltG [Nonomuraea montanisoli]
MGRDTTRARGEDRPSREVPQRRGDEAAEKSSGEENRSAKGDRGGEGDDEADTLPLPVGRREGVRRAAVVIGGLTLFALVLAAAAYGLLKPYLSPDEQPEDGGAVASGAQPVRRITLPEGLRLDEALRRISKQAGVPLADLRAVDSRQVGLPDYARGLEGFLFPATYEAGNGTTARGLLAAMVQRFATVADRLDLEERAARMDLTPLEAVTVASIVQAEPGRAADYPKIARVIYNRLGRDLPLRIDSTALYALGKRATRLSPGETKVGSPYNTYTRRGLPPGPISNPGVRALRAALHPAKGGWYWFVTTNPTHRITKFTDKESEFVRYREELNENLGTN